MIIGLTGSLASGKGVIANFLKERGFVYLSLSDELRELLKEGKIKLTRKNLQDFANNLREEKGSEYLAKLVTDKIKNQEYKKAIVDGIRNPVEVDFLRKNIKNFFLVSVDAPQKNRFERMKSRNRESDPLTWEKFLEVDNRDKGKGEKKSGQGVGKCMKKAKIHLMNDCNFQELKNKIERLYKDLQRKIPRPTWDEYFMDIMETVASRATCGRGRAGCVIVKDKRILSTGYVGSPPGLEHCDDVGHLMIKSTTDGDPEGELHEHCVRTIHAEQNAIVHAARAGIALEGSTLYCKMEPCPVCARMIIAGGIKRVVVKNKYHRAQLTRKMFEQVGIKLKVLNNKMQEYEK